MTAAVLHTAVPGVISVMVTTANAGKLYFGISCPGGGGGDATGGILHTCVCYKQN